MGFGVISLALSALVAYAGWQMRQLRNWGLSMAGAIVAMIPCSGCCLLGLPIGIWAIVVLIDNDVKRAFRGGPVGGYGGPTGGYGGPEYRTASLTARRAREPRCTSGGDGDALDVSPPWRRRHVWPSDERHVFPWQNA